MILNIYFFKTGAPPAKKQAPEKMKYFKDCESMDQAKALYYKLALQNHPDRGGDLETMKAINDEWDKFKKNPIYANSTEAQQNSFDLYSDIIEQIINCEGLNIEICNLWIWISGDTYKNREALKNAGFMFAPKKRQWYYRAEEYRSPNARPLTFEQIRKKYGSVTVETQGMKKVSA